VNLFTASPSPMSRLSLGIGIERGRGLLGMMAFLVSRRSAFELIPERCSPFDPAASQTVTLFDRELRAGTNRHPPAMRLHSTAELLADSFVRLLRAYRGRRAGAAVGRREGHATG
jgi:hypothetical protein